MGNIILGYDEEVVKQVVIDKIYIEVETNYILMGRGPYSIIGDVSSRELYLSRNIIPIWT